MEVNKVKGFSLISLMIASSIGIFLVAGISTVFVSSKTTYNFRAAAALSYENTRFAIQDLQRYLVLAGRGINPDPSSYRSGVDDGKRTFPAYISKGDAIKTTGIVNIDNQGSSIIAVRYASGSKPCGESGTVSATTTIRFFINANSELVCEKVGVYQRPIVSGIIRMRALYGIDTDSTGSANQYLEASVVENEGRWDNVVSIRVGLITSSAELLIPSSFRPKNVESMGLLGTQYPLPDTTHFFNSSSITILFRNLNKTVERQ